MAKKSYDLLLKLLVVGDSNCGKVNLIHRFTDPYNSTFVSTIGIDFRMKSIEFDGKKIKLQIWDTASQERFNKPTVTKSFYRGAHGILFVYSISDPTTFESITKWLSNIAQLGDKEVQIVLVGNHCEKEEVRRVERERGEQLAAQHGVPFIETRTVDGRNVEKAFLELVKVILEKLPEEDSAAEASRVAAAVDLRGKDEKSKCF